MLIEENFEETEGLDLTHPECRQMLVALIDAGQMQQVLTIRG